MIEFHTLGTSELRSADGGDLSGAVSGSKRLALLSYLVLATPRGFQRRDRLLALFWPELDEARARSSLRNMVYLLRQALGPDVLVGRGDDEVGVAEGTLWCDALAFENALDEGRLREALELYRGELLAGFHVRKTSPDFEHWLDGRRTELARRAADAARRLTDEEEKEDPHAALPLARRWLDVSPHDEAALRRLLGLLDRTGDRTGAIRAYRAFAEELQQTLGLEPSAETRRLVAEIRSRESDPAPAPSGLAPPAGVGGLDERGDEHRPSPTAPRRAALYGGAILVLIALASALWLMNGDDPPDPAPAAFGGATDAALGGSEGDNDSSPAADLLREADLRLERGDATGAEALYHEALSLEPHRTAAWWGLGEVLFLHGPTQGSAIGDARVAYEHVRVFDPDHPGTVRRLAQIAAAEGDVRAVEAFADSTARLDPDGEDALMARTLVAFAGDDPELRREVLSALEGARSRLVLDVARTVAVHAGDRDGARQVLALLQVSGRPPEMASMALILDAHLAVSEGRWSEAAESLEEAELRTPRWGLPYRAHLATLPFHHRSAEEAAVLSDRLRAWDPADPVPLGDADPFFPPGHDLRNALRSYLLGAVALAGGDRGAAGRASDRLARRVGDAQEDPASQLDRNLKARIDLEAGDPSRALALLREEPGGRVSPLNVFGLSRFLEAGLLADAGEVDEALRLYSSFDHGLLRDLVFLAPSHLERGRILEEDGEGELAARHYRRFLALWSDPDPELRPLVEEAERRLEALGQGPPEPADHDRGSAR